MEKFFDLREFLIAILKRLKMLITITLIFTFSLALVYFMPLAIQYLTYDSNVSEQLSSSYLPQNEQPYYYQARRTLYIPPILTILGETYCDDADMIVNAYTALNRNVDVLQPLTDEFFEEAKQDNTVLKQKMVDLGYITRSTLNTEYKLTDFYSQFIVESANHMVHIYFTSGNSDFSTRAIERAEQILTAYVAETVGSFSYKITEGQIGFWLPAAEAGMRPKVNTATTDVSIGMKPTVAQIGKRTAKGAVLGFGSGLALSVFIIFFINVIGLTISGMQDLKEFSVKIIGYCIQPKKKWLGFVDKWVAKLEGQVNTTDMETCCKISLENVLFFNENQKASIMVSGLAEPKIIDEFTNKINSLAKSRNVPIEFTCSPCITYNADTINISKSSDSVILVEQANMSNKAEITRELESFKILERDLLGFVYIEI